MSPGPAKETLISSFRKAVFPQGKRKKIESSVGVVLIFGFRTDYLARNITLAPNFTLTLDVSNDAVFYAGIYGFSGPSQVNYNIEVTTASTLFLLQKSFFEE